jgi:sulfite reductase (ferredoxin)
VLDEHVDTFLDGAAALGLSATPSVFRRSTMACTGIEFCKLAIVETKETAARAVAELEGRLSDLEPLLDRPISLHVNGCPNSCARIQVADIGLKGQIVTTDSGEQVPGFQVHLGGGLAGSGAGPAAGAGDDDAGLGRTVRGLKVTAEELAPYVERVVRRFAAGRRPGETFATWAHRVDDEELA